jgi:hypothetical protein
MDGITVDGTTIGVGKVTTKGYKAALNQARTFDIGFYSDAPTHADWTVWVKAPPSLPISGDNHTPIANGQLIGTIDQPSGHNGHRATVTVTPTQWNAMGVVYVELHSVLQGGEERTYPLFVSQQ